MDNGNRIKFGVSNHDRNASQVGRKKQKEILKLLRNNSLFKVISKDKAEYQEESTNCHSCHQCDSFQPPNQCYMIGKNDDTINPNGKCKYFELDRKYETSIIKGYKK